MITVILWLRNRRRKGRQVDEYDEDEVEETSEVEHDDSPSSGLQKVLITIFGILMFLFFVTCGFMIAS